MKSLLLSTSLVVLFFSSALTAVCLPLPDSTEEMIHCKMTLAQYPQPIHLYIPKAQGVESSLKLFIHFHGHNLKGFDHFSKSYGDYGRYLYQSAANAVLAVPESLGNCTTYDQFFSDQIRTALFFRQLENEVESLVSGEIHKMALSGHSGAYRVLNRLMGYASAGEESLSKVDALGFFDATYGATPNVAQWLLKHSEEKVLFYNAYVSGEKATAEKGSHALEQELKKSSGDRIYFEAVKSVKTESLLEQHFNLLKRGSLESFWMKASAL